MFSILIPVYVSILLAIRTALAGDTDRFLERTATNQWALLILDTALPAATPNHRDRIDLEEQRGFARIIGGFWIEGCRVSERKLTDMDMLRMLVQEEPQIGGRIPRRSNRQEHGAALRF